MAIVQRYFLVALFSREIFIYSAWIHVVLLIMRHLSPFEQPSGDSLA